MFLAKHIPTKQETNLSPPIRSAIRAAQESARARGDHTFTMPEPCANGHSSPRYTSNGICQTCSANGRLSRKPEERQMKIATTQTRVIQFHQDSLTASLSAVVRKRFGEVSGRPVSGSVIHKAAIAVLAKYLSGPVTSADLRALIR